jgi:hypothetical protein
MGFGRVCKMGLSLACSGLVLGVYTPAVLVVVASWFLVLEFSGGCSFLVFGVGVLVLAVATWLWLTFVLDLKLQIWFFVRLILVVVRS